MKIQLVLLLLVVLFVSMPSVVFAQPPLGAVQSGGTSQTAPTAVTAEKSWEGPVFGFGLGLGWMTGRLGEYVSLGNFLALPVKVRLGYGLSERAVLYGSLNTANLSASGQSDWVDAYGMLGMMWLAPGRKKGYALFAFGASFESGPPRPIYFRWGGGYQVYPGAFLEAAQTYEFASYGDGLNSWALIIDLTLNYHFY